MMKPNNEVHILSHYEYMTFFHDYKVIDVILGASGILKSTKKRKQRNFDNLTPSTNQLINQSIRIEVTLFDALVNE